jgi:hypothetical protein
MNWRNADGQTSEQQMVRLKYIRSLIQSWDINKQQAKEMLWKIYLINQKPYER